MFFVGFRKEEGSAMLASSGLQAVIISVREAGAELGIDPSLLAGSEADQLIFTGLKRTPSQSQTDWYHDLVR